jgi:hypothetical protein
MDIHQMQVLYDPQADRLRWQLRTFGGELFAVWLTRRMMLEFWPRFHDLVARAEIATVAPGSIVLPEAREMLAQAARARALPTADFRTPFDDRAQARPLGAEPLLPATIDFAPAAPGSALAMRLRAGDGRSLELRLSNDLAIALARLIEQALAASDWGIAATPGIGGAAPQAPRAPS